MKKLAVVVREPARHYEALRSALGCLLEDHQVSYVVLNQEIHPDEAFTDNLGFLEEMEGRHYSNNPACLKSGNSCGSRKLLFHFRGTP